MPSKCKICPTITEYISRCTMPHAGVMLIAGMLPVSVLSISVPPTMAQTVSNNLVTSGGTLERVESYNAAPPKVHKRRTDRKNPLHRAVSHTSATTDVHADSSRQRNLSRSKVLGISLDLTHLELSDEQKHKIQNSRKFAHLKLHELKQAKAERIAQLKIMLFNPSATDAQIRAYGEEIQRFQTSIDDVNLDSLIQLRTILTPEQRSKLSELDHAQG